MQRTEKVIEINAPVWRVFDFFSDFESFPRWMRNIKEVRYSGRRYTRWTADAPFGSSVEWEAETTRFEPDHRIAWRSVRGDVYTEGEVIFEETRRGTTRLHVVLGYDPPAGRLGALVAHLFGKDPEQQLEEDLERFADAVEGRPRRVRSDSYDGRGAREGARGPARHRREARRPGGFRDDFAGRDAREDYDARGARHRSRDDRDGEYRARDYEEDDEHGRERDARRRFDDALREARRSQLEGQRRYREERERDEQRRYGEQRRREWDHPRARDGRRFAIEEEAERRREMDERLRERRMNEQEDHRSEDEHRRPPFRHPMTPREWERERENRQPNYDYSREAFRRGVDKLMEEPPSGRWRRWE